MSGVTVAKYIIEAALFSAGKSITIEEVSEATGLDRRTVRKAAKELIAEYSGRDSSLTVTQTVGGIALEVRAKYARYTMKLAEQEIPRMALKTLAIIAFHQPIKQSKLKMMIGSRAYEDVKTLREMGLISVKPEGRSYRLETSSRFPDYFGIDPDPVEIKKHLADLVGVTLQEVPEGDDDEAVEGAVGEESNGEGPETEGEVSEDTEDPEDAGAADDVGTAAEELDGPIDEGSNEEPDEVPEEPSGDGSGEAAPEPVGKHDVAEQVGELPIEEPEAEDAPEMDIDDDDADAKYGSGAVKEVQAALHDDGGI